MAMPTENGSSGAPEPNRQIDVAKEAQTLEGLAQHFFSDQDADKALLAFHNEIHTLQGTDPAIIKAVFDQVRTDNLGANPWLPGFKVNESEYQNGFTQGLSIFDPSGASIHTDRHLFSIVDDSGAATFARTGFDDKHLYETNIENILGNKVPEIQHQVIDLSKPVSTLTRD